MMSFIESLVMLQIGGVYGSDVGGILAYWESVGFFSYVLPFLLIFALVFGILTKAQIFKDNRVVNGIIALTVGLLSLQFNFVPMFFSEIFPRLGVGLAVILVALILVSLFVEPKGKGTGYFFLAIGIITFIVVVIQSFAWTGSTWSWWFYDNWPKLLSIVIILVLIGVVVGAGKNPSTKTEYEPIMFKGRKD